MVLFITWVGESANSGGKWGPYLKFAGYDAVAIKGASDIPVYLSIINGKVKLMDVTDVWGMTTFSISCGRVCAVPNGPFSVIEGEGPEYETIFAFGSDCGVADLEAIIKANHL